MTQGTLYLIPCSIGFDEQSYLHLPAILPSILDSTSIFVVENIRSARRFLIKAGIKTAIDDLIFYEMDKHQDYSTQEEALMHIFSGKNIGLLSESGLPCLADPGNKWVMAAHQMGIKVRPISGPSSIFLLLIASGLNGQNFAFHGYLPKESTEKKQKLKELSLSAQKNTTHIFIETPYRNNSLLTELVSLLDSNIFLSVGVNISTATEIIKTHTIREWKQLSFQIPKEPCIFAFGNSRS